MKLLLGRSQSLRFWFAAFIAAGLVGLLVLSSRNLHLECR
ncbi:hypothetical protein P245_24480 [Comamonas thiooxydans]|uniref:Uncharacterized protein n=1 Tax=Comamonas thiooxydans TaxID=363952 RepID=A0A0E3B7S0_9BURK|nr:hypothetical protein P245_24480 [Comamonas thiooxydans]